MKTRILAPILVASLGLGILAACSSNGTSEAVTPTTVQVTDVPTSSAAPETSTSTVPVTTTSAPPTPSTTAPKRQVTTTFPAAPKTKTPAITGTPSEILDKLRADVLTMERATLASGDFGSLDPKRTALSAKYAGSAVLTYNRATSGGSYTVKSGDLTQVWYVELDDYGDLVLVER